MPRQSEQQWFREMLDKNTHAIPDTNLDWLNETRNQARESMGQLVIPNRKQENWRYTELDDLYGQYYRAQTAPITALDEEDIDSWVYPAQESYRLVFANGRCVPELSNIEQLPHSIKLASLNAAFTTDTDMLEKWLRQTNWFAPDVFTELNAAMLNDGLFIHVPKDVVLAKPIEVVFLNLSFEYNVLAQPRSLIILEQGAQAKLVERYMSTGESEYFFNAMTEIYLGPHARLQHYRLQQESQHARHLSRVAVRQDTASEYQGINLANGAQWSRTDIFSRFDGPHASCDLAGLYTVGADQYTDFHLDVQHRVPQCRSRENFRGIIYGQGHAVFDGRVLVAKDAQKTDAQLTNKNLLLTRNAEVDTKPQLEIYADDVKCSHGTTVGKLDPNQLFYLRSRGISEPEARNMLCLGFAEEILAQVEDVHLHDFMQAQIAQLFTQQEVMV